MTPQRKQRHAEPSIVVDPSLDSSPSWCSEETVLFRREMLDELIQPAPKKKSPPSLLLVSLGCIALIAAAVVLRLLIHR